MGSRATRLASTGALVLFTLIVLGSSPSAIASGDRLVVNVPEPFEVGGRLFPAGLLAMRHLGDYNPTTTIDQITVGNECLGMLMAQHSASEPGLMAASLVFERSSYGHLRLVGYTASEGPAGGLYLYHRLDRGPYAAPAILVASR
jgi:hypothetical protein